MECYHGPGAEGWGVDQNKGPCYPHRALVLMHWSRDLGLASRQYYHWKKRRSLVFKSSIGYAVANIAIEMHAERDRAKKRPMKR